MCWVTFYQNSDFGGYTLSYTGTTQVSHLSQIKKGKDETWQDTISSLKLGPESWLILYKDHEYEGSTRCFGPNTIVRHMSDYDFNDEASSFKLFDQQPANWQPSKLKDNSGTLLIQLAANQTLNDFGDLVAGIAGCVPKVGSALKGLVNFLWPDNTQDVWVEIKKEVTSIIHELVDEALAQGMEFRMQGLNNLLQLYIIAGDSTQRSQLYTSLLAAIADDEPYYLNQSRPETTLVYFVNMGTIALSIFAEQCRFYEDIYGQPDSNAPAHLKLLQDKTTLYLSCAAEARQAAMDWRLSLITVEQEGPDCYKPTYWVIDSYNGCRFYCDAFTVNAMEQQYRTNVQKDYDAALDVLLYPSTLWKYLDPTEQGTPVETVITAASGPFGGTQGKAFEDRHDQRITKVIIHAGSRIDGIEVFYGGQSGGLHGGTGGNTYTLDLGDSDGIVAAYGKAGGSMDQLFFRTAHGQDVGGGGNGGGDWSAIRPAGTDAVLGWISGVQGSSSLESLTFHWVYIKKT